jgi:Ca2+-transporting ATPase
MWAGILYAGAIMAAGTLLVLDASLPGGPIEGSGNMRYADDDLYDVDGVSNLQRL